MKTQVLAAAIAAAVASLATTPVRAAADAPHYVADGAAIVKAANWDAMQTVTVELADHHFEPEHLKLKLNQPYRLVIANNGAEDHYYTAEAFFRSVAWRKVQTPRPGGGEVKAPYFTAVEAYKNGGRVELFFVPTRKGRFDVLCTIDDHKDKGMHGSITVE